MFLGSTKNFERQTFVHRCCCSLPTGVGLLEPERPPRSHRCSVSVLLTVLVCQLCFREFTLSIFVQMWQGYRGFNAVEIQLFSIQDTSPTLFKNANISKRKRVSRGAFLFSHHSHSQQSWILFQHRKGTFSRSQSHRRIREFFETHLK